MTKNKRDRPKQGVPSYPWRYWMTRRVNLRLVQREDFFCAPYIMAQQIRNAAARYGVTVSISIQDKEVSVSIKKGR